MTATLESPSATLQGYEHLDKIAIEIGDVKGRQYLWKPTGEVLRGRFPKSAVSHGQMSDELAAGLPDVVPGLCVELDFRRDVARIYDPLGLEKNLAAWEILKKRLQVNLRFQNPGTEPTRTYPITSKTMAKTWLWNMAVLVAGTPIEHDQDNQPVGGGPQARVVSGTLPSLDEIAKLPGKIRIGQQSAGVARKYRETELVKVDEE